ncbi:MAG TPA: hypothetical protein PKC40_03470 [Saprospiraceae bacterium]|nr:hypothetical protein [Saprospiraceae bacterium]
MNIKLFFTLFFALPIFYLHLPAQTKIGLVAGMDFLKLAIEPNGIDARVLNKSFDNRAFVAGIQATQFLTENFNLSITATYSTIYRVPITNVSVAPANAVLFNNFRIHLNFGYQFFNSLNFGIGPAFSLIPSREYTWPTGYRHKSAGFENEKEFGISASASYAWRNITAKFIYYRGTDFFFEEYNDVRSGFKPVSSISFLSGYQFSTKKEKRRKR